MAKTADRAGQGQKRLADVGTALPAGAQPAVLVQPADGAFDRPMLAAQVEAVELATAAVIG